jgi:hypothetical protein
MGLWAAITGVNKTGEVVDAGLDLIKTGAKGLDAMFYTSEEKAQDIAKNAGTIIAHAIEMNKLMNEGSTASSKTRRALAYAITGVVLFTFIWCVCVLSYAYLISDNPLAATNAKLFVSDVVAAASALYIGGAFTAVCILFFGYYGLNKVIGKK